MFTGTCLCKRIKFQVEGPLEPIQICYCSQCRRAQGSALATNIPVSLAAFTLLRGEDFLQAYQSSARKQRVFCRYCGSPLYSQRSDLPDIIRIRAGLFDGDLEARPIAHCYTASRPNWWEIHDDLPQFPETYSPEKYSPKSNGL